MNLLCGAFKPTIKSTTSKFRYVARAKKTSRKKLCFPSFFSSTSSTFPCLSYLPWLFFPPWGEQERCFVAELPTISDAFRSSRVKAELQRTTSSLFKIASFFFQSFMLDGTFRKSVSLSRSRCSSDFEAQKWLNVRPGSRFRLIRHLLCTCNNTT